MGCLHQRKFTLDRRGTLQGSPFTYSASHLAGHRFNLLIFADGRFNPVRLQMIVESFVMVFNHIRALLVGIVGTGAEKQAGDNHQSITPLHRVAASHVSTTFHRSRLWPSSYSNDAENSTPGRSDE